MVIRKLKRIPNVLTDKCKLYLVIFKIEKKWGAGRITKETIRGETRERLRIESLRIEGIKYERHFEKYLVE